MKKLNILILLFFLPCLLFAQSGHGIINLQTIDSLSTTLTKTDSIVEKKSGHGVSFGSAITAYNDITMRNVVEQKFSLVDAGGDTVICLDPNGTYPTAYFTDKTGLDSVSMYHDGTDFNFTGDAGTGSFKFNKGLDVSGNADIMTAAGKANVYLRSDAKYFWWTNSNPLRIYYGISLYSVLKTLSTNYIDISGGNGLTIAGNVGIETQIPSAKLTVNAKDDTLIQAFGDKDGDLWSSADSAGIMVLPTGDVEIGNANTAADLKVFGNVTVNDSITIPILKLAETTTPSAEDGYGKVYTKTDNHLYFQDGAGSEHVLGKADTYYGEFYWDNNSNVTTIETANIPTAIRETSTGSCDPVGFTYGAGSAGAITAFADYSGTVAGTVLISSAAHGLATGDFISIRGTTNYNSVFEVTNVAAGTFYITHSWDGDDGASDWDEGSYLEANTGSAGKYLISYCLSLTVTGGDYITSIVYHNIEAAKKSVGRRKFATGDQGNLLGQHIITIADGDRIFLTLESTGANNLTIQYGNLVIRRL